MHMNVRTDGRTDGRMRAHTRCKLCLGSLIGALLPSLVFSHCKHSSQAPQGHTPVNEKKFQRALYKRGFPLTIAQLTNDQWRKKKKGAERVD